MPGAPRDRRPARCLWRLGRRYRPGENRPVRRRTSDNRLFAGPDGCSGSPLPRRRRSGTSECGWFPERSGIRGNEPPQSGQCRDRSVARSCNPPLVPPVTGHQSAGAVRGWAVICHWPSSIAGHAPAGDHLERLPLGVLQFHQSFVVQGHGDFASGRYETKPLVECLCARIAIIDRKAHESGTPKGVRFLADGA